MTSPLSVVPQAPNVWCDRQGHVHAEIVFDGDVQVKPPWSVDKPALVHITGAGHTPNALEIVSNDKAERTVDEVINVKLQLVTTTYEQPEGSDVPIPVTKIDTVTVCVRLYAEPARVNINLGNLEADMSLLVRDAPGKPPRPASAIVKTAGKCPTVVAVACPANKWGVVPLEFKTLCFSTWSTVTQQYERTTCFIDDGKIRNAHTVTSGAEYKPVPRSPPLVAQAANTVTSCGQSSPVLECPIGSYAHVISARWGRTDPNKCANETQIFVTNCGAANNIKQKAMQLCEGKPRCEFSLDVAPLPLSPEEPHDVLVDPCPGVSKYVEIEYECHFDQSCIAAEMQVDYLKAETYQVHVLVAPEGNWAQSNSGVTLKNHDILSKIQTLEELLPPRNHNPPSDQSAVYWGTLQIKQCSSSGTTSNPTTTQDNSTVQLAGASGVQPSDVVGGGWLCHFYLPLELLGELFVGARLNTTATKNGSL
eukprot:TRINITY_DN62204_c0_g1_i1.p1 TRINITY_DN62204_c0_g1~~TRINITY_DN62204_c0_g1_i1.p1  ORF type:complete len:528 (+),score=48.44 TRINITY_DN62204_c0_g1_i1:153-1586(+)